MVNILKYAVRDFSNWWNEGRFNPKTGYIDCYCSASGTPFGSGKTVSVIHEIMRICKKYACEYRPIHIWSNIDLDIHQKSYSGALDGIIHHTISNLQDFVDGIENNKNKNVVNILFIDEMAAEFNNRNFSKNFTPDFLAKLVTCRHYNTIIFYTTQNYYMVDKVFRDLTTHVYTCKKLWRFFFHKMYLPEDMEAIHNAQYVKPVKRNHFFADDFIFSTYDTFARFKAMDKAIRSGEYKSAEEINDSYRDDSALTPTMRTLSRKGRRVIGGTP